MFKKKKNNADSIRKMYAYLSDKLQSAGVKTVYSALLLYYAYGRSETPRWAKNIILGSITYLVSPFDTIPDLTPFLGFTDDLGVLSFGMVTIACYINEDVRTSAKNQVNVFFGSVDEKELLEVDSKL